MSAFLLALQLIEAIVPLVNATDEVIAQVKASQASLQSMEAQGRDPTADEIAAQTALIAKLQAQLAAG